MLIQYETLEEWIMEYFNATGIPEMSSTLDGNDEILDVNVLFAVLIVMFSLTTCLANLGIIIAFWKNHQLKEKPNDLLMLALSVLDFFQGLILFPLHTSLFVFDRWIGGETLCKSYIAMAYTSVTAGLLLVSVVSLDRLLLVTMQYPHYVKYQSKQRILFSIACCLAVSLIPAVVDMAVWDFAKSNSAIAAGIDFDYVCLSPTRWMPQVSLVFLFVFVLLPVVLVAALSIAFIRALHKRLNRNRRVGTDEEESTSSYSGSAGPITSEQRSKRTRNRYIKPGVTLGALVVAMTVSVCPYLSYVVIVGLVCQPCLRPALVYQLSVLLYSKPLFDAVLYSVTESKMRQFYKSSLRTLMNHFTR